MRSVFFAVTFSVVAVIAVDAQQFGTSVAIHDGVILVGEPKGQESPSAVHVFRLGDDGWMRTGVLEAPAHEGPDFFGISITPDGDRLLIGDMQADEGRGGLWVYESGEDGWQAGELIRPATLAQGAAFGKSVLIQDDIMFVSGFGDEQGTGAVWVYSRTESGSWEMQTKITPGPGAPEMEFFGWSMAFNGEHLMVGALQASRELQQRGAVYLFSIHEDGSWELKERLTLPEAQSAPGDGFGAAVGWLGRRAVVGIPGRDRAAGEVRTYDLSEDKWVQGDKITNPNPAEGALFGMTIDSYDGDLWIGSPGADDRGAVYRLRADETSGGFELAEELSGYEADIGDQFGASIAIAGNVAVVGATGDDFGLGSASVMELIDGTWTATAKLVGPEAPGLDPLVAGEVGCEAGKADQFECSQVDIVSFLPVRDIGGGRGAETNDVWGWTDSTTGREYALVGRTDGTSFIDITDPEKPIYLGNLPKTEGSRANSWRDIKVYANHAFIVADGANDHGMQIFDLTRLRNVENAPVTFGEDAHYDGIASAHNIVINEQTGFAYAVGSNSGGETCGGGLHMIDIRNPTEPVFAGCFADTETGEAGTGYSHDAMCIVYNGPDTDYQGHEICFGSNENALSIADVTDKENPVQVSSASYPDVAYAHQGWITDDHMYFYMNDEGDESSAVQAGTPMEGTRTLIWDVQDLDDPIMVNEHFGTTFTIDHNLYIKGDLMYQSNYVSGLRVLDISDRENPQEVGFFDTVPWSEEVEFDGSWSNYPFFDSGTIVVSSGKEGVFFLKYRPTELVP